jgi:hypothetical protein
MALYVKNKQITTIYKGNRHIAAIYEGTKLIWQYIRSCFGRGYWINDKPWSNTDGWKN